MKRKTKNKIKRMGNNLNSMFKTFQKQRKSKKGIGGFLQRIADNQKY